MRYASIAIVSIQSAQIQLSVSIVLSLPRVVGWLVFVPAFFCSATNELQRSETLRQVIDLIR